MANLYLDNTWHFCRIHTHCPMCDNLLHRIFCEKMKTSRRWWDNVILFRGLWAVSYLLVSFLSLTHCAAISTSLPRGPSFGKLRKVSSKSGGYLIGGTVTHMWLLWILLDLNFLQTLHTNHSGQTCNKLTKFDCPSSIIKGLMFRSPPKNAIHSYTFNSMKRLIK